MDQNDKTINRAVAYRLIGVQQLITIILALSLFVLLGKVPAYSALLGGLVYILPNAYFVACALSGEGQTSPQAIVRWFYISEVGKWVLTGLLFAACFLWVKPLHAVSLFVTYIIIMAINLAGLAFLNKN